MAYLVDHPGYKEGEACYENIEVEHDCSLALGKQKEDFGAIISFMVSLNNASSASRPKIGAAVHL